MDKVVIMGRDLYCENAQLKKQLVDCDTLNVLKELKEALYVEVYENTEMREVIDWDDIMEVLNFYAQEFGGKI